MKFTTITRHFFLCCFATLGGTIATAQPLDTPRPSPASELSQTIGMTEVKVNYSRPQVIVNGNDRTGQIWGQLVPYGFQKVNFGCQCEVPWRAGANENTVVEFSNDVRIEGRALPAGKYGLHIAVFEDNRATVIFSQNTTSWGSFWYDPAEDALRVDIKTTVVPFTNVLTYQFVDLGNDYGVLALDWEKKRFPVRIEVNTHEDALQAFREELRGLKGFSWQGPMSAANYCLQNNVNHEEALRWADRAIAGSNGAFQPQAVKLGLLFQTGKKDEALKMAEKITETADINNLNALGYAVLQGGAVKEAIKFFKLNVERNPDVANCYDSLGEAYMAVGDNEQAIKMFKTSLSKDPPPFVKANSINNLKKLGVDQSEMD